MNKAGIEHESKYPLTTQNLGFIQDIIFSVAKLSEIGGKNYILSGCRQSGDSVTEGIIVINGEIMPFNGGAAGSTIIVVEEKGSTTADGHNYANARVKRYARFGTGATTYPWSDFKPLATNTQLKQEKADISYVDQELAKVNSGAIPTGAIIMWSGTIAPTGWMICNGDPNPKTGKNVPDLRGRFVVGYHKDMDDYKTIGANTTTPQNYKITLSPENIPSHNHKNGILDDIKDSFVYGGVEVSKEENQATKTFTNQDHDKKYQGYTSKTGSGTAFDSRPPYYVLAYIIKI